MRPSCRTTVSEVTTTTSTPSSGPLTGGPGLPQERRLVTEIPGPRSKEKFARRGQHVAQGVSTVLPVFVEAAGGGVLVDVDGNSLIDLGSGIAVVSVGNAAPHVVERVIAQTQAFTHTCFMVTPYDGYVDVCEQLAELTPGDHAKKSALLNSGAEAVENAVKVSRAFTGRDAVAVVDHAYHGRTNLTMAMTAKSMPYKHSFGPFAGEIYRAPTSYPFREPRLSERADLRGRGGRSRDRRAREAGGCLEPRVPGHRADPRRGRLRRARRRVPAAAARVDRGERHRVRRRRDPDRLLPHRRLVRVRPRGRRAGRHHDRQGDRRWLPAGEPSPGAPTSWTRCTSEVSAAPTAATRSPARRRWAPSRPCASRTSRPGPARSAT